MSEPATFAIVRDGQQRYYADRWASVYFIRELVWGPEALESWASSLAEIDEWYAETGSAVVVDFDNRKLIWMHEDESLAVPKIAAIYNRLLTAAWPGWVIQWGINSQQLNAALGIVSDDAEAYSDDEYSFIRWRPKDVNQAAQGEDYDDEDDEDSDDDQDDEDHEVRKLTGPKSVDSPDHDDSDDASEDAQQADEPYEFDEDELRAWVTITDSSGAIRHRQLHRLSQDLLQGDPQSLARLNALTPSEIPAEHVVTEGMWIEEAERTIGIWGGPSVQLAVPVIEQGWSGWDVQWAPRGYSQHCAATGPSGQMLSIESALARVLPKILSTERFTMSTFVSAIGGSLKKNAVKGTGCLLMVICSPLLIFGAVSGNWTAVLITVAIVVLLAVVAFKVIENKIKRSFKSKMAGMQGEEDSTAPATAGPLDPTERRKTLDKLLATAGLPPLSKVEPLFPPKNELGLP